MNPSATTAADALVEQFERGHLSRRQLVARLIALGAATVAGPTVALAAEPSAPTTAAPPTFTATGLDHLALSVTDVRRSVAFYQRHLGLRLSRDGGEGSAFLDCPTGTGDRRPDFLALFRGDRPGLHHFSFSVPDYSADDAMKRLEGAGLTPRRQGNRVYFPDPDGLTVQVHE